MKKILFISALFLLGACGTTTTQAPTTTTITTTTETTTKAPVITKFSYDITEAAEKPTIINITGKDGITTHIEIVTSDTYGKGVTPTKEQIELAKKVMEESIRTDETFKPVIGMPGLTTVADADEKGVKVILAVDLTVIDAKAFKEKAGISVYEFFLSEGANSFTEAPTLETVEAILKVQGGKKMTN